MVEGIRFSLDVSHIHLYNTFMVVVITNTLDKKDVEKAREDYRTYIKVTADIKKKIVAIGGEYHADADEILVGEYECENRDIWGGGYNIENNQFETNALINIRQPNNPSMEIIDPEARKKFIELVQEVLVDLPEYL